MRRERLYLADMLEAAEAVQRFIAGSDRKRFADDDLLRSAVLQKLTLIGEAAARLPKELQERHPDIPWADIVGFRNIAVHAYFAVDWNIVWTTATADLPELTTALRALLAQEFPE